MTTIRLLRLLSLSLSDLHIYLSSSLCQPPLLSSLTMKSFNTDQHGHSAAESGDVYAMSDPTKNVDDDGREKRTGTWLTASAHIITAVIGSGVLSLAWAIAQLGWIAGTLILIIFSFITYFTSTMLADFYRAPDPLTGKRNYTYMDVVRSYLGMVFSLFFFFNFLL